jgi:predicted phage replisome organizer
MGEVKWIKVSTDMFNNNRKIKQIELMPEGDAILVIWLKLLLLAGNINDGGAIYLTPEIPYTDEMLANELRKPLTTVRLALSVFERYRMIEIVDDILMLSSWEKYQSADKLAEIREKNRIRQANYKKRQKEITGNVSGNVTVTLGNAVEEEGEEEGDSEEEFHSLTHSARESADNDEPVENSPDRESLRLKYLGGSLGGGVVMLSEEQFSSLCDELSYEELNKYIGIVRDCELAGQHYKKKTHYQAILDMAMKDRKVK